MKRSLIAALFAWGLGAAAPAQADVAAVSSSLFVIQAESEASASPQQVWRALIRVERWWSGAHTYSGDAARLRLDPRAGGCFCERWGDRQSVEHARVLAVMEHEGVRTLRLEGALGPLQAMGARGVLTFTIRPHASGAQVEMTYRVSGDSSLNLEPIAPLVDGVMMEQFRRLIRYSAAGAPA